jgi:endo-1,4-beta-xylanase
LNKETQVGIPLTARPSATRTAGITRRQFVSRLAGAGAMLAGALSGVSLLTGCGGSTFGSSFVSQAEAEGVVVPLKDAAQSSNILYGAATGAWNLQSDSDFAAAFAQQCGLLVPENDLKWETVEPEPGVFNFAPGDWLANFAGRNGMRFRGHCLVWHQQIPSWAGYGSNVAEQLTSHITSVVTHYAGRMHSWDVVNEAVEPNDGRSDGLRETVWLNALGPGYIDTAFRAAAAADPKALLVYNEYGLEGDSSSATKRRNAVLKLLSGMKSRGVPLHALGIEAHLSGSVFDSSSLASFLEQVAALGLKIFITELDVSDKNMPADTATRDNTVANVYQAFLSTVLQQRAVEAVLTWGLSDRYTWLSQFSSRSDGLPVRPLPIDTNLKPKQAYWAMLDAFNAAPIR